MGYKIIVKNPSATARKLTQTKRLGLQIARICGEQFDPYVPMKTGRLANSWKWGGAKAFSLTYDVPYAGYQYRGKCRFCGKNLVYSKAAHPLATSHWDQKALKSRKQKIIREINQYIKTM